MKRNTKVVLSRILASAMLVGAMFSNVVADPQLDTAVEQTEAVADTVATPSSAEVQDVEIPTAEVENKLAALPDAPVLGEDYTLDFRDGSIIPTDTAGNVAITDGFVTIDPGTQHAFSYNGAQHGVAFNAGNTVQIGVAGPVVLQIGGCQYSNTGDIEVVSSNGDYDKIVTTAKGAIGCYAEDDNTINFAYDGPATTLTVNFTTTTYVPVIKILAGQDGSAVTSPERSRIYSFDFTGDTMTAAGTYGFMTIEETNAAGFNGPQHGVEFKDGTSFTFPVSGNTMFKFGGCQYSASNYVATATNGDFVEGTVNGVTAGCYDQTGDTADITYVGGEGTVTITVTGGKMYLPHLDVVPVYENIDLIPWVQKNFSVDINGTTVSVAGPATSADNATITVSAGSVVSAATAEGKVKISLGKQTLADSMLSNATGCTAAVVDGKVVLTLADSTTKPYDYTLAVVDSDNMVDPKPGDLFNYQFTDGSVLPTDTSIKYSTFTTDDGVLTYNSPASKLYFHDGSHGLATVNGDNMVMKVAGNAIITFATCQHSQADAVVTFTDESGAVLGTCPFTNNGGGACGSNTFAYKGAAGVITATVTTASGECYLHGLTIQNETTPIESNGKVDVWDFGGAQLDSEVFNNRLSPEIINGFYDASITAGTSGNNAPASWTAGSLSWVGGINDRFRVADTTITRYDENVGTSKLEGATGRLYINKADDSSRAFSIALKADDVVTVYSNSQAGGTLTFEKADDPTVQSVTVDNSSEGSVSTFVAVEDGTYKIYGGAGKPSYYRITRADAEYSDVTVAGTIDKPESFPLGSASLVFTNTTTGKKFPVLITSATQTTKLPTGYTYSLSLDGADEFIVAYPSEIAIDTGELTKSISLGINAVDLVNYSGTITGLTTEQLAGLSIEATTPSGKIYNPQFTIDATTGNFTAKLEKGVSYAVAAKGVNDFDMTVTTVSADADKTDATIGFTAKAVSPVTINLTGEGASIANIAELKADTKVTFTNLNEEGYVYTFGLNDAISLRDGVYTISLSGYNKYPVAPGLISNLTVNGGAVSKDITLNNASKWAFGSLSNDTITSESAYNGLLFSGTAVKTENGKSHLVSGAGSIISVPVKAGQNVNVGYYYAADFTVNGETVQSSSGSTSKFESSDFVAPADGMLDITVNATTYFTSITVGTKVPYTENIYVGTDKEYKTINEALDAVRLMDRPNGERVIINIDPGDYQEMLVVDMDNVTLKNASANANTALTEKGAGITADGVRVTSYYLHGYNYFSMTDDCKYDEEVLKTNKENGYISFENPGSGTTKNSYWNATVTVRGAGFEADGVIFENSANQYVSSKEANDVVQEWPVGGKGTRPTTAGDTSVQDKSFVERAAAIALLGDKAYFNNCKFVGRQDTLYGATNIRAAFNKCVAMGGTDFIFGGMVATFYKSDIMMNTSEDANDVSYLTAAQQDSGRGYLFYDCNVTSTTPGVDTASAQVSKPGYFGRPWKATTSETVFVNTTVGVASDGTSLVSPAGWLNTLGGEAPCYEYNTTELSGIDNSANRVAWSTVLTTPALPDGTELVPYTYTKGTDNWEPIKLNSKLWGDVDSNGKVEAADAALIIQYVLRPETVTNFDTTVANVSEGLETGLIDSYDAALVLQKSLDSSFLYPFERGTTTTEATTTEATTETTTTGETAVVYVVGDSTGCHYADTEDPFYWYKRVGFGDTIGNYLNANVINLALSGRSSKSFATGINENGITDAAAVANYAQLKNDIKAGDYLIIAWGHNDEKTDQYRFTDPTGSKETAGSFKNSLYENYIKVAQDAGATPILCTPIIRRNATGTLGANDLHQPAAGDYGQCIRDLATELNITLIDNLNITKDLFTTLGAGTSATETADPTGYAQLHAATQDLATDNTHLNKYGANVVAYNMAQAIKSSSSTLAAFVNNNPAPTFVNAEVKNPDWVGFDEAVYVPSSIWKVSAPWAGSVYGSSVGVFTEDSHPNCDIVEQGANSVRLVSANNKGKIASSEDGMVMYFQKIDANQNFTMTATAHINSFDATNNQGAFGIMCRDNMFSDYQYKTKAPYVAIGDTAQSSGSQLVRSWGRIATAVTNPDGTTVAANALTKIFTSPDAAAADTYTEGTEINLSLSRVGNVYTMQYGTEEPITFTNPDLATVNAANDFVGVFVARTGDVTFKNINLTLN